MSIPKIILLTTTRTPSESCQTLLFTILKTHLIHRRLQIIYKLFLLLTPKFFLLKLENCKCTFTRQRLMTAFTIIFKDFHSESLLLYNNKFLFFLSIWIRYLRNLLLTDIATFLSGTTYSGYGVFIGLRAIAFLCFNDFNRVLVLWWSWWVVFDWRNMSHRLSNF